MEYNVWVRIERADEETDEYENLGEPVKLGSFGLLSSAISKVLTLLLAEMPPSGIEIADYRRWHAIAVDEEREAEGDETPSKFAVGDTARIIATGSHVLVVGYWRQMVQVRMVDGMIGMFAPAELERRSD